jgi:glycosyltransferase involved in cell wall biosynthesis
VAEIQETRKTNRGGAAQRRNENAMRILYADLEREWRGGQSQALLTLEGLRERGHEVELLAARDSPLAKRATEGGIAVHQVRRFGLRGWAAGALRRLIAEGRFELVHLNEPHALTAAWLAGAQKRLPLLLSRRIGFPLQKNLVSQARYRAVERFVANSKNVAQSLIDSGIAAKRISIVNEGVEIPPLPTAAQRGEARKHWNVKEHEFLFGCVSVFVPEKGQRHLIEALPIVRALHPEARLLLAGNGACRAELETLTNRLGQTEAVLFPGFVSDVGQVYAALDAFAFPSEFEGLGTALQAGMAAGLPCISTRRGALAEVVDHERTALVAEPNGNEFAAVMLRMLADSGLRKKLSEAGRREVEQRFSAGQMVENTIRVYEDVLKKEPAA